MDTFLFFLLTAASSTMVISPGLPVALPARKQIQTHHLLGVSEKLFEPAKFLIPSNSMELKPGLLKSSHKPINSIVFLFCLVGT